MKSKIPPLLLLLVFTVAGTAGAQDPVFQRAGSAHYEVFTDGGEEQAREVAAKMEAAFQLFSGYFHFEPGRLPSRLQVRIFRDKAGFDAWLGRIVPEKREDFVVVTWRAAGRAELLGFRRDPRDFDASLLHQGFIQYLDAFIPGAPLWLQTGMAACLERSVYDPGAGLFRPRENLSWLPVLRRILRGEQGAERWPVAELVTMGRDRALRDLDAFYPQAWGLVHFLLHSEDRRYNRALWDAISALDPADSEEANAARVYTRAFSWLDEAAFRRDYESHVFSRRTFLERVQEGIELYGQERLQEAEESFRGALLLRSDHYLPHYYLGLIGYSRKDYRRAADEYRQAQELGAEPGLALYALGVNAFAERRYEEAGRLLRQAAEADPAAYGEKVETLLERIEALR